MIHGRLGDGDDIQVERRIDFELGHSDQGIPKKLVEPGAAFLGSGQCITQFDSTEHIEKVMPGDAEDRSPTQVRKNIFPEDPANLGERALPPLLQLKRLLPAKPVSS